MVSLICGNRPNGRNAAVLGALALIVSLLAGAIGKQRQPQVQDALKKGPACICI